MRCVVSVVLQLVVESGHRRGFHALTHMKQWGVLASPRKTIKARMYVAPRPTTNVIKQQSATCRSRPHIHNELAKTILKVLSVDKKNVCTIVSIFSSSQSPTKKRSKSIHQFKWFPANKETKQVSQSEANFLIPNCLNSCPDTDLRKN